MEIANQRSLRPLRSLAALRWSLVPFPPIALRGGCVGGSHHGIKVVRRPHGSTAVYSVDSPYPPPWTYLEELVMDRVDLFLANLDAGAI